MEFRILGPLEAYDGNQLVNVGGARQRALLALLLLHANEVVSSDRLVAELWGEDGLDGTSKALQVAVSRLRRALGSDVLATRPPGYVLQLEHGQLDLQRFEADAAAGREAFTAGDAARAADLLKNALALWRGEPLADLAYESFAQGEIGRLDELRSAALEDRIAADLELGRHADVVGELQELVERYPVRERLREQLMLALYRSGRQADALAAYQDARGTLVEELGIEPGRGLRELHEQILRQDAGLEGRRAGEAGPEPAGSDFVGREGELAELVGAFEDALAGRGRLALLIGEPGIGKSRLADELMGRARARGARVIVGRCWEAGGAPAYWPWIQALRAYVREADPDGLRAQLGTGAMELAQLLPELRELFPDLPEPPALESEGARFRLFEAVSAFLKSAAGERPLVLVIDDLHAADEPSLLLLRFLARELAASRLLVVCAFRDVDPTPHEPLTATLAELVREPLTARIGLTGLTAGDVAEYIELSTGVEPAPVLVEAIHAETEGNPLFVAEVVHLLATEGRIAEADAHLRIPPGVRAVIGQRVGRLSERCRRLLLPASVMGREFSLDVLAALSQLPRDDLFDALDEAIAERVIGDVPGSPGRLRFGHALIRDTLYDELAAARRLQLHADVVEAIETVYSPDLESHLAELAHHSLAALPTGGEDKAVEYLSRAGARATAQLAHEEAIRLYEAALPLVADDAARCQLLIALGDAQARAGHTPESNESFRAAADLAERLELNEELAQAALGYGGRLIWEVSRGDVEHIALLERALEALGEQDGSQRVRLLARLASSPLREAGIAPERRLARSEEALDMARRIGDPATLAYALAAFIAANHSPEFTRGQVVLTTELIQLATEVGELERAAEGHEQRAAAFIELGEMERAKADVAELATLADRLRQPSQQAFAAAYRGLLALLEGDFVGAESLLEGLLRLAERADSGSVHFSSRLQLYALRRGQGRLDEVEDLVRSSVERYPTYPMLRCVLAQTASELGHDSEARETFEALAADDFGDLPFDETWLAGMTLLAESAHALGDTERAPVLYELLLPYSDRLAISYAEISTGAVSRPLALLAATVQRWDDAERHFEEALATNERTGARPWLAYTQHDYARMLLVRGGPPDLEKAEQLTSCARTTYRELGMKLS